MGIFPKDRDLNRAPHEVELAVDGSFYRVKAGELVVRLDRFLGDHMRWRSRTSVQSLIRDGYVRVDASTPEHPRGSGELEVERRPGRKLRHGSRVVVSIPEELRLVLPRGPTGELDVLYEDEHVVAVEKPSGIAVHPSGRHMADTLIQRVHAHYEAEIAARRLAPRLCHRLDRETSGIVLVGKRPRTHAELLKQFEARSVEKEYLAIVWGELDRDAGRIEHPLAPARVSSIRLKMTVAEDGQPARTDYRVVARHAGYTLVRCRLLTGRQHQIRVHLAALGHAVVGDKLYGPDEGCFQRAIEGALTRADLARLELPRQALHHDRLVFRTPAGGEQVEVTSPLAPDLAAFLEEKRRC